MPALCCMPVFRCFACLVGWLLACLLFISRWRPLVPNATMPPTISTALPGLALLPALPFPALYERRRGSTGCCAAAMEWPSAAAAAAAATIVSSEDESFGGGPEERIAGAED